MWNIVSASDAIVNTSKQLYNELHTASVLHDLCKTMVNAYNIVGQKAQETVETHAICLCCRRSISCGLEYTNCDMV